MYKKGTGNDKQGKDAGNRTTCPYRNFSQAIITDINVIPLIYQNLGINIMLKDEAKCKKMMVFLNK